MSVDAELERLRKKVQNYPSPSAFTRLAELLLEQGDKDEAEQVCQRAIKAFPRNGRVYQLLGELLAAAGKRNEALDIMQQGLAKDSRNVQLQQALAELQAGGGAPAVAPAAPAASGGDEYAPTATPAEAAAQRSASEDSDAIDLTGMASGLTSIVRSHTPAAGTPAPPAPAAAAKAPLKALCEQDGVRGAVIADAQGRTVASQSLNGSTDDLLAALAQDVNRSCAAALENIGITKLTGWSIAAANGQAITYLHDNDLTLTAIAAPEVKVALLEMRARQALIDMGAG